MANQQPWAVLLCKYKDDPNDPTQTKISDLAAQWRISFNNPAWVNASWDSDERTILGLYQEFFSTSGLLTYNMIQFFATMSHGNVFMDDTQIFTCTLDRTIAEAQALAANPGGAAYQNDTFEAAKSALKDQYGVDWHNFYAIIVSFQYPDYGSQGGSFDGGPGVFMDIRYVKNNGSMRWGHEMGHGFGLDHSRADSPDPGYNPIPCQDGPPDYRDPWDTMSAECNYSISDPDYGRRGPGLNAWNMRSRGWLNESRVWNCPQNQFFQSLQLRPLYRTDLPGVLAAELPPLNQNGGYPKYLVEYRIKSGWDAGIPRSAVFVHRFDGNLNQFMGTHSYVEFGSSGNPDLVDGDTCSPETGQGPLPLIKVIKIDDENFTADIELSYLPPLPKAALANGDPFAITDKWGTLHVLYRDSANQISDLYYQEGTGWQYIAHNVAGAPAASGDPFAIMDKWGTFHILYRDSANQISDIYYQDGAGWQYIAHNLANAPTAAGDPFAIADKWGTFHILYRDSANQISDIYYQDGAGWQYIAHNLPNATSAAGDPFAIADKWGTFHILYRDSANQISDIYYQDGAGWQYIAHNLPNAPSAAGDPFAIADSWGTFHILYRDSANQISDIYYQDGAGWQYIAHNLANALPAAGDPFAITDKWGTFHILYRDSANQISDIYYQDGTGWQYIAHNVANANPIAGDPFPVMDQWGTFDILYRNLNDQIGNVYYSDASGWIAVTFPD